MALPYGMKGIIRGTGVESGWRAIGNRPVSEITRKSLFGGGNLLKFANFRLLGGGKVLEPAGRHQPSLRARRIRLEEIATRLRARNDTDLLIVPRLNRRADGQWPSVQGTTSSGAARHHPQRGRFWVRVIAPTGVRDPLEEIAMRFFSLSFSPGIRRFY